MKRKLVSVLLVASIVMQCSTIFAIENSEGSIIDTESTVETTDQNADQTVDQTIDQTIDQTTNQNVDQTTNQTTDQNADQSTDPIISQPMEQVVEEEGEPIPGDEFTLKIDSKTYLKNGNTYSLSAPPVTINSRNYLPIRFVADTVIGGTITFDQIAGSATIVKDDTSLKVTIGNKVAYLNGQPVQLDSSVVAKNGTTYIPVKILSDYFNISTSYDSKTKKITLVGQSKGINHKPIAGFEFGQVTYTEGQIVKATSTSYEPDGQKLKDKLWCVINGDQVTTNKELVNIMKKPKAGIYRVGLKVQDELGLWSEWTYKELTVLPNEAPTITYLGTEKSSYAQGEKINYQYYFDNESWEKITNEKWTYRHAEEDTSKAILGKPDALFTAGEYIVTLEIDDEAGNRSQVCEATVKITEEVLSKELSFRFTQGNIGDIIDNYQNFNYRDYADALITSTSLEQGTMIMSDSPEEVTREGILYRDVINGKGRLLIHHINKFSDQSVATGTKRVVIVAENKTDKPVQATLSNKTIKGPVTDILYLGQKLLYDYLAGSKDEVITLQPGEKQYIYDSGAKWKQGMCISGLMDITTNGEVTFTMASVSAGSNLKSMSDMELFLQAVHPRGTFEGIGINYTLSVDGTQPTKLILGNGEEEWVKGYDALTQDVAYNKGNYGVSYYITITATEDMGVILNPRANVFRGAIKWVGEGVYNTPSSGTIFSNTAKAVSLGTIKAGETKTLEYMLANGSSAPVVLAFIPRSYWDD